MQTTQFKHIKHKFPKDSWIYSRNEENKGEFDGENILYIEGNYETDNLDLDEYFTNEKTYLCILVEGSLTAKNIFNNETDGAPGLIVLGNLVVNNLIAGGQEIYVTGNLIVHECFWGDYNHGDLVVKGNTAANVFIATDEYHYDYHKERTAANHFLCDDDTEDEEQYDREKMERLFLPEMLMQEKDLYGEDVYSWKDWLWRDRILAALQQGKPVLKNSGEILAVTDEKIEYEKIFSYNPVTTLEQMQAEAGNFIKLFNEVVSLCDETPQEYERNGWTVRFIKRDRKEVSWIITAVNHDLDFAFSMLIVANKTRSRKTTPYHLMVGFDDEQGNSGLLYANEKSTASTEEMFTVLWHTILKDAELGAHYYKQFHKTFDVPKAYSWFSLPVVTESEAEKLYPRYETSGDEWRGFWKNDYMFYFRGENEATQYPVMLQMAKEIPGDEFDCRSYRFEFDERYKPTAVSLKYNSSQQGKFDDRYKDSIAGEYVFPFDWERYKEAADWYNKAGKLVVAANQEYLHAKAGKEEEAIEEKRELAAAKNRVFTKPYETVTVDGIRFKVIDIHEADTAIKDLTDFQGNQLYDVYTNQVMFPLYEENPFFLLAEEDVDAESFSLAFSTDECPDIFILGFIFLKNLTTKKFVEGCEIDVSPVMIVLGKLVTTNLMVVGNTHYIGNGVDSETIWGVYNHGSLYVKGETQAHLIYADDMQMHFEKFAGVGVAVSSWHGLRIFTTTHLPQEDGTFIRHEYEVLNTHKLSDIVADQYILLSKHGDERISEDGGGKAYEAMLQGESIIDWNKKERVMYSAFQTHFEKQLETILALPAFKEKNYVEWKSESGWEHYFVSYFIHNDTKYVQVVRNLSWGNIITTRIVFVEGTKDYHLELIHYNKDNTVKLYWDNNISANSIEARSVRCAVLEVFKQLLYMSNKEMTMNKTVSVQLTDSAFTINNTIVNFPVPVTDLQSILGEYRLTKKEYNSIYAWDELGILAYSKKGELAESLVIDFAYGNFDYSPQNKFKDGFIINGQDAASFYKANKGKLVKLSAGDSGGAIVLNGISAWYSVYEDSIQAIQLSAYKGPPQKDIPSALPVDDEFGHLIPLWNEWINEVLKIVSADNKYYNLTYGITQADIQAVGKLKDFEMPKTLLNFYKINNVEFDAVTSAFHFVVNDYEYDLIPFNKIHGEWESLFDLYRNEDLDELKLENYDERLQAADYANPKWIPFADAHNGDYLLIDLDPSPSGKYGQIIELQNESWERTVVADSFEELLQMQIDKLKAGDISSYDFILERE